MMTINLNVTKGWHELTQNNSDTFFFSCLRNTPHRVLPDIVQMMRSHPEEFPQWHTSPTAALFTPPTFKNKKESKGYWF